MPFKSYREQSKTDWGINLPEQTPLDVDQIQIGALLRIADATELMASNYKKLQEENIRLRKSVDYWMDNSYAKDRKIKVYKGVITKLKRKLGTGSFAVCSVRRIKKL